MHGWNRVRTLFGSVRDWLRFQQRQVTYQEQLVAVRYLMHTTRAMLAHCDMKSLSADERLRMVVQMLLDESRHVLEPLCPDAHLLLLVRDTERPRQLRCLYPMAPHRPADIAHRIDKLPVNRSHAGRAMKHNEPYFISDLSTESDIYPREIERAFHDARIRSLVVWPITIYNSKTGDNEPVAVLQVDSPNVNGIADTDAIRALLAIIAELFAIAMDTVRINSQRTDSLIDHENRPKADDEW